MGHILFEIVGEHLHQPGGLRVSLRSRGAVDVSAIASGFGGGGHFNAAGFTVEQSPEQLLPRLFDEVSARYAARVGGSPRAER